MTTPSGREEPEDLPFHTTDDFDPLNLPNSHHLVITTPRIVNIWDINGTREIFRSGSSGIVASRRSKDGSGLLAVADSQVVILHDVRKGRQRSYRLKGKEGQVRLLEFSNDSRILFFTTTLQNTVQSYSLRQSHLLEPSHVHPSPPTCIALSSNSHMLVSCSATPPTVYLQNVALQTPHLVIRPAVSAAPIRLATFHPKRQNLFLLAFEDGVIALYDATRLLGSNDTARRKGRAPGPIQGGELAYITNAHNSGGEETSSGITAAKFLPGYKARVVTTGIDGRCNVVDFEHTDNQRGHTVGSWHVRAPATSLSILSLDHGSSYQQSKGSTQSVQSHFKSNLPRAKAAQYSHETLIAIGRIDGKVFLYDQSGRQVGERSVDMSGDRIVDVEWVEGLGDAPVLPSSSTQGPPPNNRPGNPNRKSALASSKHSSDRQIAERHQTPDVRLSVTSREASNRQPAPSILGASRFSDEVFITIPSDIEESNVPNLPGQPCKAKVAESSVMSSDVAVSSGYGTAPASPPKSTQSVHTQRSTSQIHQDEARAREAEKEWQDVGVPPSTYLSLFSPVKSLSPAPSVEPHRVIKPTLKARSTPRAIAEIARPIGTAREIQLLLTSSDKRASAVSAPQIWGSVVPVTASSRRRAIPRSAGTPRRISIVRDVSNKGKTRAKRDGGILLFAPYLPSSNQSVISSSQAAQRLIKSNSDAVDNDHDHDHGEDDDTDLWLAGAHVTPARIPIRKSSRFLCSVTPIATKSTSTTISRPATDIMTTESHSRRQSLSPVKMDHTVTHTPCTGCIALQQDMYAMRTALEGEVAGVREEFKRRLDKQDRTITQLLLAERQRERRSGK